MSATAAIVTMLRGFVGEKVEKLGNRDDPNAEGGGWKVRYQRLANEHGPGKENMLKTG
jgi:hypothetical protein